MSDEFSDRRPPYSEGEGTETGKHTDRDGPKPNEQGAVAALGSYLRAQWGKVLQWHTTQKILAEKRSPTRASVLLAMACYTRGLWTLLRVWRHMLSGPYRARSMSLRADDDFVALHLAIATLYAIPWTAAELLLFVLLWSTGSGVAGVLLVYTILLQWLVFPWYCGRRLWRAHCRRFPENRDVAGEKIAYVITEEDGGQIPDLGYLLREANFSIDVDRPLAQGTTEKPVEPPPPEEFYQALEEAFADQSDLVTQRIAVIGSSKAQPGAPSWVNWREPFSSPSRLEIARGHQRLLVFGQNRLVDGLTTVEVDIHAVKSHLSFNVRQRWLPPLRKRIARLALTAKQRRWWRGQVVPGLLLLAVLLTVYPVRWVHDLASPVISESREGILQGQRERPALEAERRLRQEPIFKQLQDRQQRHREMEQQLVQDAVEHWKSASPDEYNKGLLLLEGKQVSEEDLRNKALEVWQSVSPTTFLDRTTAFKEHGNELAKVDKAVLERARAIEAATKDYRGKWHTRILESTLLRGLRNSEATPIFPVAFVAALIALAPLVVFALVAVWRVVRWVRGILAGSGRCYLNVAPMPNLRFVFARDVPSDDDAMRLCIAHGQIAQEIVTNRIIAVLQKHGIDSTSIRAEMSTYIFEGIYMTGGHLEAGIVNVGRGGKFWNRFGIGRKNARRGQGVVMDRPNSNK